MHVDEGFQQPPDGFEPVLRVTGVCFLAELWEATELARVGQAQSGLMRDKPGYSERRQEQRHAILVEFREDEFAVTSLKGIPLVGNDSGVLHVVPQQKRMKRCQ